MLTQEKNVSTSPTFAFKGGMFTLTTIQLYRPDFNDFAKELEAKIKLAPKFFNRAPVLIDFRQLPKDANIDVKKLVSCIQKKGIIPFGIRGATPAQQEAAIAAGLAILPDPKIDIERRPPPIEVAKTEPQTKQNIQSTTRIVRSPVRSGQQIHAENGDLLVMAPVSHGAELLADGHIYVFGPLRGRALAGINGDTNAMIFCNSLEAELVSCAGQYKVSEDLKEERWALPARIELQDACLQIHPL